jgi:hypothetical protein
MRISMLAVLSLVALTFVSFGQEPPAEPRLVGIIDLPDFKRAVLELSTPRGSRRNILILAEGQRDGLTEVDRINPREGSVDLRVQHKSLPIRLAAEAKLEELGIGFADAELSTVLTLYQQFVTRTGLRSPHLQKCSFTLHLSATNQAAAASALENALVAKGITTIPDGEKFVMIVPKSEVSTARPGAAAIKFPGPTGSQFTVSPEDLPAGTIDFRDANLAQVAMIYAEMLGRKLERGQPLRPGATIALYTQTMLTKAEALYALETLFRWEGLKMEPVGADGVKLVPVPEN